MLFDSEIEEKRLVLRNILHKIYANMVNKRKMIRKVAIKFLKHHNGAGSSDILDFFASIIRGFQTPLNDEKLTFFMDILLPLHKKSNCELYLDKLTKCCLVYLEKEETLALPLIEAILSYFPQNNELKQKHFLNELTEVFMVINMEKYSSYLRKFVPYIMQIMAKSLTSEPLFPFAIKLLLEEKFFQFVEIYKTDCFPILVPLFGSIEGEGTKGGTLMSQNSGVSVDNAVELKVSDIIDTINMKLKTIDEGLYEESIKLLEMSEEETEETEK